MTSDAAVSVCHTQCPPLCLVRLSIQAYWIPTYVGAVEYTVKLLFLLLWTPWGHTHVVKCPV